MTLITQMVKYQSSINEYTHREYQFYINYDSIFGVSTLIVYYRSNSRGHRVHEVGTYSAVNCTPHFLDDDLEFPDV